MPFKFNPFTGTLDEVGAGSTSGGPFLPLAGGTMDAGAEIAFDSDSLLRQSPSGRITLAAPFDDISGFHGQYNIPVVQDGINGTIDISNTGVITISNPGIGYTNGPAIIGGGTTITISTVYGYGLDTVCAANYIHRWEGGTLYITDPFPGQRIRVAQYKLTPPDSSQDETLGYRVGSLYILDNGNKYICTDATATAAVWHLLSSALPLTYAATLTPDCNDGLFRSVAMTGDLEINAPTNGVDGMRLRLRLVASGAARELTFQAAIVKPTGSTYEATVASGSYRIVELEYNGSFWMMTKNLEFPD